jgi:hypothetical protein
MMRKDTENLDQNYQKPKPLQGKFCFKQLYVSNITFIIELFLLNLMHEET